MSGVIDEDGTQWEHCIKCHGWVDIRAMRDDMCDGCFNASICFICGEPAIKTGYICKHCANAPITHPHSEVQLELDFGKGGNNSDEDKQD